MKNLLIAVLAAANLVLGLGLFMLAYDPPAARAQGLAPAEYLIIPVSSGNTSVLCVVNSQTRKVLTFQIAGQTLRQSALGVRDLHGEFDKNN